MAKAKKQETKADPAGGPPAPAKPAPQAAAPVPKAADGKKPAAPKKAAGAAAPAGGGGKKAATKAESKSPAPAAPQAPLIDTGLAAQTAAAMVAGRLAAAAAASGAAPKSSSQQQAPQESSSFKNLKDSLNKPSAGSLGGILGTAGGQKKFAPTFGGPKQNPGGPGGGRNQTFGADVNRAGVPRRTGGG